MNDTEFFVILSVQLAAANGYRQSTIIRVGTFDTETDTAGDIYNWARDQLPEDLRDALTVFYSAVPNRLNGTTPPTARPPRRRP